jgi:hypothetical protein
MSDETGEALALVVDLRANVRELAKTVNTLTSEVEKLANGKATSKANLSAVHHGAVEVIHNCD